MESLPTIVPTDTADDETMLETADDGGDGVYYECKEHGFVVVGAPASDGSDDYIDEQIDEHERQHAEEARARGAQPAIALDGDSVVFGEVAAAPVTDGRDLHRKIVAADLADLAEHALEHEADLRPGTREWEVLRTAADAAQALAELLPAADAHGIECRDLAALAEHALSVLGRTIEAVTAEPSTDTKGWVLRFLSDAPHSTDELARTFAAGGDDTDLRAGVQAALTDLFAEGRIRRQTSDFRWVVAA